MEYSIGRVSEMFGLPVSTLRYYDKEGLFPNIERVSGIRKFGEKELESLRVIECLKKSGLEIKDIKQFMEWCALGRETYQKRLELFQNQCKNIEGEIARLEGALSMLKFKCWYYETGHCRRKRGWHKGHASRQVSGRYSKALRRNPRQEIISTDGRPLIETAIYAPLSAAFLQ